MFRFILLLVAVALQEGLSYRSVCYYTNWSQYRHSKGKYTPSNVDPSLCTHIIYAFATLSGNNLKPFEWNDESTAWSTGMYEKMMAHKAQNPALKIMLGVGGWNLGTVQFSSIARSAASRTEFAKNAVAFIRKHNFDGLDNDWEYPGSRGSPAADKHNNVLFMQELRRAFDEDAQSSGKSRLLLSEAIGIGKTTVDNGYDMAGLSPVVDFFNVMTYDFHGTWESFTGMNAPLFADSSEVGKQRNLNVDWAVDYLASKGMPKEKMNLGIPTYGRSFTLRNPADHGLGAAASRGGDAGRYTGEKGFISYYEVCEKIQSGAQVYEVPDQHSKYLVQGDQWVGFDDVSTVKTKACYARQKGLGGVMYWALDLDDFSGRTCNQGRYPLIKAANQEFQSRSTENCPKAGVRPPVTNAPNTPRPQTPKPVTPKPQTPRPHLPVLTNRPDTPRPTSGAEAVECQPGTAGSIHPHPTDCHKYVQCNFGTRFEFTCPSGLAYNPTLRSCDHAFNVASC